MSSGFVPAGENASSTTPDEAWVKAQQFVAQSRSVEAKPSKPSDGKSLYDILQQNKAAKQEAFEEAARLKNQFRSLDDDEVEFLDSVLESTRAKEAEVRKETAVQLEAFRKQREAAEKAQVEGDDASLSTAGGAASPVSQESWAARPKKRRRDKDAAPSIGAKLRKMSSTESSRPDASTSHDETAAETSKPTSTLSTTNENTTDVAIAKTLDTEMPNQSSPPAGTLGLVVYGSDED